MCEIGIDFTNIQYYNKEMKKGMEDKLFFINKLPSNNNYVFVDFGCADGTMISTLATLFEHNQNNVYIGYDISQEMISIAKTNYSGPTNANVTFTTNWEACEKNYKNYKKVLILSSVIHEVYSYSNKMNIELFWKRITSGIFDYIVIRDMCPSKDINRPSDEDMVYIVRKNMCNMDRSLDMNEFENIWGTLDNNHNLIHFLLKYRWKVNWEREVHENYFPIYADELIKKIISNGKFNIDYFERFRVQFLDKCFKEDFDGLQLNDFTHIKAIFSKTI